MGTKLADGLYRRGGVVYVRTDPVDGRQRSTKLRDAKAANMWLAERERIAANPAYAAAAQATVGDWILKTLAHKRGQKKSAGTLHMYETKLGHVTRIFGADAPLAAISPGSIDDYIAQRQSEGVKNNTIARELVCIRQLLRLARRAGVYPLELDQVMPVGFSAGYVPVTRTLPWKDLPALLAAFDDERAAWICLACATAGDASDVERMEADDFDPERRVFKMRGTKTSQRSAEIPIPELFLPLVQRALPYLPVSWPRSSKGLGEISSRIGLGHLSPKDLRRSACTWLCEAGVPEEHAARWMRHKNSRMVREVYNQTKAEALGRLIDAQLQKRDSDLRPLGEIGKRGGFKRRRGAADEAVLRRILGLARRELARRGRAWRSKSLQSANARRLARLRVLELTSPGAARAPIAVCRALDKVRAGDLFGARALLRREALRHG